MNKNGKDLLKIDWVNYFILDFNIILWMFAEILGRPGMEVEETNGDYSRS